MSTNRTPSSSVETGPRPSSLIVFAGPACAWKTTLAARFSQVSGYAHLEMDRIRTVLIPDSPHDRHDRRIAYRAMLWAAELLLARGHGAILDAPYGHEEDRQEVEEIPSRVPARVFLIECAVSPSTAIERFRLRAPDPVRRDLTEERVRELVSAYKYRRTGLLLDTDTRTLEECFAEVLRFTGR